MDDRSSSSTEGGTSGNETPAADEWRKMMIVIWLCCRQVVDDIELFFESRRTGLRRRSLKRHSVQRFSERENEPRPTHYPHDPHGDGGGTQEDGNRLK